MRTYGELAVGDRQGINTDSLRDSFMLLLDVVTAGSGITALAMEGPAVPTS